MSIEHCGDTGYALNGLVRLYTVPIELGNTVAAVNLGPRGFP